MTIITCLQEDIFEDSILSGITLAMFIVSPYKFLVEKKRPPTSLNQVILTTFVAANLTKYNFFQQVHQVCKYPAAFSH